MVIAAPRVFVSMGTSIAYIVLNLITASMYNNVLWLFSTDNCYERG